MSTNKTQRLGLHRWEQGDPFLREEFNENFETLDSLAVTGTYVGNAAKATDKQTINLGFQPRFLFIRDTNYKGGVTVSDNWTPLQLAFAVPGHGHYVSGSVQVVEITANGFIAGGGNSQFNQKNCTYAYLAIR